MTNTDDRTGLPPSWQRRFAFFDRYGLPGSNSEAREVFRQLSFWEKQRINTNVLAFLFAPFYFFVKGMWRKGLTLVGLAFALALLMVYVLDLPNTLQTAGSFVVPAVSMVTANYAYYLHRVHHSQSWNPFEGFGRRN